MILTFCMALLAVYSVTSYILLRRPGLIHQKKSFPFRAVHISHRGGCGESIENSLEAFCSSLSKGTNMFELDCHITKDKHVVVFHDPTTDRCTGVSGHVKNFNFVELPDYLTKIELQFRPGFFCDWSNSPPCKIARLEEIFEQFPNVPINLDVKANDDDLIEEVAKLIEKFHRERLTIWGSLYETVARKCHKRNGKILTFAPTKYIIWLLVSYVVGILPYLSIPYDCIELPMVSVIRSPELLKRRKWNRLVPRTILCVLDSLISSRLLIEHLRLRGIPVFYWVCNSETEFKTAFELGVSGVMTDYPSLLTAYLKANPQFPKAF